MTQTHTHTYSGFKKPLGLSIWERKREQKVDMRRPRNNQKVSAVTDVSVAGQCPW